MDTQLCELADNVGRTPRRIHARHRTDEFPNLLGYSWTARFTTLRELCPMLLETLALPTDYSLRFHENKCALPLIPDSSQHAPQNPVSRLNLGPLRASAKHTQLVTQGEIFRLHNCFRFEERRTESEEKNDEFPHDSSSRTNEMTKRKSKEDMRLADQCFTQQQLDQKAIL